MSILRKAEKENHQGHHCANGWIRIRLNRKGDKKLRRARKHHAYSVLARIEYRDARE